MAVSSNDLARNPARLGMARVGGTRLNATPHPDDIVPATQLYVYSQTGLPSTPVGTVTKT